VPVGDDGLDPASLEAALSREKPKLLALTANFQNPTGATLSIEARREIVRVCARAGVAIIENDIYGQLRYEGEPLPTLKALDERGDGILLRSFSKIAFPGLRVGWVVAPRPVIAALAAAKQWTDLHSDHLSQAVLLRFAESGRLARHRELVLESGRAALKTVTSACARYLPEGSRFTHPRGGMNLWIRLPEPLDAGELRARALAAGVNYLPGSWFRVTDAHRTGLRLSFCGLEAGQIDKGVAILGRVFGEALEQVRAAENLGPAPALV
jgi:2-aminoadipate transaminase